MLIHQGDTNSLPIHQEWRDHQSQNTQYWLEEDARYFLHQALSTPVLNVLSRTEGAYIYDLEGRKYLDLHGNGVHNIGFNNPAVIEAVKRQLDEQLAFTPRRYTNIPAVQLAKELCESSPEELTRVLFCPGGSEAIEMAIMLAKHITGRWKTISCWDCYHGTTYQAATVGGDEHFTGGLGPMVPGAFHVEFPNYYRNPWGLTEVEQIDDLYLRQIKSILKRNPDIACIIGTPIASAPHAPTAYYWQSVSDLCKKHGAFLIFDEIVCGLGRSGKLFACEHYITPDVVVMGKSLGGGVLPLAGIITKEEHNQLQDRSIGHFTHEKSPVGAAAGLAMLEYLKKEAIADKVAELGDYFQEKLRELQERYPIIGNIDGKGFLIGIDLVKNVQTKERAAEEARQIMLHCLQRGLSFKLYEGNVITMRPSLIIGKEEIDFIIAVLQSAFEEAVK